ncbi:MAG: response regulator [Candidatus Omnitrophota bacterium]
MCFGIGLFGEISHCIDDEEGIRESLRLILGKDYDLSFATDGQECLECLKKGQKPDLILLDIKMPKISGLDILKQIKGLSPNQKIAVVSGYKSVEMATEAVKSGASDYIVKPFESKDLLEKVEKII